MTQSKWEFVGGVSFVVFFSALAIHGLLAGHAVSVAVGLGVLVIAVVMELTAPRGWVSSIVPGTWQRRALSVCFGVFVFFTTVGGVVAIHDGDWGSFLYNGVAGAASVVALCFFAYASQRV